MYRGKGAHIIKNGEAVGGRGENVGVSFFGKGFLGNLLPMVDGGVMRERRNGACGDI